MVQQRIEELTQQLRHITGHCAPHDHAIAGVIHDLEQARQRHRQAERDLADSGYFGRRAARLEVAEAAERVTTAETALAELTRRPQPVLDERKQLRSELDRLHQHTRVDRPLLRALDRNDDRLDNAQQTIEALRVWKVWASGRTVDSSALVESAVHLCHSDGDHAALARPLLDWLEQHRIVQPRPSVERPSLCEPPGLEIDV